MQDNLQLRIDYISFRLNEDFGVNDFWSWCVLEETDQNTGEKSINLRSDQFDTWYNGGNNTGISVFKGGEKKVLRLIETFGLKVTRLDVACTIPFGSTESAEDRRAEICAQVRKHFDLVGIQPTIATIEGQSRNGNGFNTTSFWGRAGQRQLRVYSKTLEGGNGVKRGAVRLEWQLRSETASKAFEVLAKKGFTDPKDLFNVFQSITEEHLAEDFFGLGVYDKEEVKPVLEPSDKPDFQLWLDRIVIPSLVRQEQSNNFDGVAYINLRAVQIKKAQEEQAEERKKSLQQKKVDRVKHGVEKKLKKGVERVKLEK